MQWSVHACFAMHTPWIPEILQAWQKEINVPESCPPAGILTTKILTFVCLPAAVDASTSDSARARVSVFVLRTSRQACPSDSLQWSP